MATKTVRLFMKFVFQVNLIVIFYLLCISYCFSQNLEDLVLTKINILNSLITDAQNKGIDAYKEKMTVRTAQVFLDYATWDEVNVSENTDYYKLVPIYKDSAQLMAEKLPDFERSECLAMLNESITTINQLINDEVRRPIIPKVNWTIVTHDEDQLTFNDRPVFVNDYTWKPGINKLTEYHGNLDGFFLSPNHVIDENGTINNNILNDLGSKFSGPIGFVFLNNKALPEWVVSKYGQEFLSRQNTTNFTKYDIDHPGAKELIGFMLDGTVSQMANKRYTKLGYMLCNEPHFFTKKNEWASDEVSELTKRKFNTWLAAKHSNIHDLNSLWSTDYKSFDDVTIEIPINGNLQGTPKWYDWSMFNMNRVTDWYQFVKNRILVSDPNAKVHLKIMPRLWSDNLKDHGIDLEALTEMSEIIGNDAGAWNNHMWGSEEWWEENYSFDFREMAMGYDFLKSVSPNKIAFNSESHYLSKNKSRNLYQDPLYARATYWLAHTLGENASQTWYWARQEDGSIRSSASVGYAGSNNQQPRIVNEVASTLMDLNCYSEYITAMQRQKKPLRIYYSKTSAINKADHMDALFELYKDLFFEGVSLGFATEGIIKNQENSDWEVILIHDTQYVTKDELATLQEYLDNGGNIIMDDSSLKMDEYGNELSELISSNGNITIANSISQFHSLALDYLEDADLLPKITITESNLNSTKGVNWRWISTTDTSYVLSLINLGNKEADVSIELLKSTNGTNIKNLLTGVHIYPNQTLRPNEMLFVEVTDEEQFIGLEPKENVVTVLYPNPTSGYFQLGFEILHEQVEVSIFAESGKLIVKKNYQSVKHIDADISDQPTGVYFVQIKIGEEVSTEVIMKN